MNRLLLIFLTCSATLLGVEPSRAEACGACFGTLEGQSSVDQHNMVISLFTNETILWDQIVYSGNPKDFVWVLPLPTPDATIAVTEQQFFSELAALTSPRVRPPPRPQTSSACGGGGEGGQGGVTLTPDGGGSVTVYDQAVVGPYETVIIGSEDANALQDWLTSHNYRVLDAVLPTIAYYVARGDVFAVMRLAPGQDVSAMQPVRVTFPGYMTSFPLNMVKIGAALALELNLIVIADERMEAGNFSNRSIAEINTRDLVFDYADGSTNYQQLFDKLISDAGGRAWVTEYSNIFGRTSSDDFDDYELIFKQGSYPVVTRLRTKMSVELIDADLVLARSEDNQPVSNQLVAGNSRNDPRGDISARGDGGCSLDRKVGNGAANALVILLMALVFGRRRLLRRSGERCLKLRTMRAAK